jgi:hypothetical protein
VQHEKEESQMPLLRRQNSWDKNDSGPEEAVTGKPGRN